MLINAYCSFEYLQTVTNKNFVDYIEPGNILASKSHLDILDLICNGLDIKTDKSEEEIEKCIDNPYIKYLIKNFRIKSQINVFLELRTNHLKYFTTHKKEVAIYLLGNFYKSQIPKFQDCSGYHFLTPDDNPGILFDEELESFVKGKEKNWIFANRFLNPHNSLIMADKYLSPKNLNGFIDFIKQVVPKNLSCPYHLTLIVSNKDGYNENQKESFKKAIEKEMHNAILEVFYYNGEDFHDRYIITNNTCIFCGYGFKVIENNLGIKEGSWVAFKPFKRVNQNGGKNKLFYTMMKEKLGIFKNWIEKTGKKTINPLFNI